MLKKSIIYYVECIAISFVGYVCGGGILSFLLTEIESVFSLVIPIIISIIEFIIRIKILNKQLKEESNFNLKSYFDMSIPALLLLILTVIILLCDVYLNNTESLIYISIFDNVKMCIWVLFPGALFVDGIIYNLSHWNDMIYYVLLIANIFIYILPVWIYMTLATVNKKTQEKTGTQKKTGDG